MWTDGFSYSVYHLLTTSELTVGLSWTVIVKNTNIPEEKMNGDLLEKLDYFTLWQFLEYHSTLLKQITPMDSTS